MSTSQVWLCELLAATFLGLLAGIVIGRLAGVSDKPCPPPEELAKDTRALSTPIRIDPDPKRDAARVCLGLNAYYEARGESYEGQIAVGQVALRRAGLDFHRVCAEIYRPGQFSWTASRPRGSKLPVGEAWQRALEAADAALAWAAFGIGPDYSRGATYYHAEGVRPYWTTGLEKVAVVDNHVFYR